MRLHDAENSVNGDTVTQTQEEVVAL
jgi:hypothetical protein